MSLLIIAYLLSNFNMTFVNYFILFPYYSYSIRVCKTLKQNKNDDK